MYLGDPIYIFAALLQMSNFGGGSAESLKTAIDSIFSENGQLPCRDYLWKVLACTSDGASVNTGKYEGLLTRLARDGRDWLVQIHCVNHRIELAVKDAMNGEFDAVESLYMGIFNLFKNSGAIKSDVKKAAEALDISFFTLTKITGTRFVSHRRRSFSRFLDMWPAIIKAFENTLVIRRHKPETRAKIQGFLKKLNNYELLCLTCTYLDVLDKISPASLVFEGNGLLAFEIDSAINLTKLELEDISTSAGTPDELLDSHLARFQFRVDDDGEKTLNSDFTKQNHNLRKLENRETIQIEFENMTHLNADAQTRASNAKSDVAQRLIQMLERRFVCYKDEIFKSMKWFDPRNWMDSPDYGATQLQALGEHFKFPLEKTEFDAKKVLIEWKRFKLYVKTHYEDGLMRLEITAAQIWRKIFQYRRTEFPNLCILAATVMVQSGSNSSVERGFSMLTALLSNRRIKLNHATIEMLMMIKINDKLWSDGERNDIIEKAADIYLSTKRKRKLDEIPCKRPRMESMIESDNDSDNDSEDSEDTGSVQEEDEQSLDDEDLDE